MTGPPPRRRSRDARGRSLDGPMRIADALGAVSERLGTPSPDVLSVLFGRWDDIVGASMAAHVRPARLHEGTLVVHADHPAWATQVRHLSAEILARARDACGAEGAPDRLEVRVRS